MSQQKDDDSKDGGTSWALQLQQVFKAKIDDKAMLEAERAKRLTSTVAEIWNKYNPPLIDQDNYNYSKDCEAIAEYVISQINQRDVNDKSPVNISITPSFKAIISKRNEWKAYYWTSKFESVSLALKKDFALQKFALFFCRVFDTVCDLTWKYRHGSVTEESKFQKDCGLVLIEKLGEYFHDLAKKLVKSWNLSYPGISHILHIWNMKEKATSWKIWTCSILIPSSLRLTGPRSSTLIWKTSLRKN